MTRIPINVNFCYDGRVCRRYGSRVWAPTLLKAADGKWGDLVGRFVYDGPAPYCKSQGG